MLQHKYLEHKREAVHARNCSPPEQKQDEEHHSDVVPLKFLDFEPSENDKEDEERNQGCEVVPHKCSEPISAEESHVK